MTDIQWFVLINRKQEGPFSFDDLKKRKDITPDTLVWKEGMDHWLPIRDVAELNDLFKESSKEETDSEEAELANQAKIAEGVAITLPYAEPPWFFWLIFFLLIGLYVALQSYFS